MSTNKHGTYAGVSAHQRIGEPLCIACKEAARQYQAEWRKKNPAARARGNATVRAGDRARRRLAQQYLAEYRALFAEEKAKLRDENRREPA